MPYPFGAVLKRKIMDSNYWHYGVASEFYHPKTGKQMVYQFGGPYEGELEKPNTNLKILNAIWPSKEENTHTGYHIGLTPYDVFSEGRNIVVEDIPENPVPVLQRARSMVNRADYNTIARNCEHFAKFALEGDWKSSQANNTMSKVVQNAGLILVGALFTGSALK